MGDDCLCKAARTTRPLNTLATAPVPSTAPAEPTQALSRQPSAPAPKVQKPKDAKKAEEADKKAKEVWAQIKRLPPCLREGHSIERGIDVHMTQVSSLHQRWRLSCSAYAEWQSSVRC